MNAIVAPILIVVVGVFSLALMAISIRTRQPAPAPRHRSPPRMVQAGAVPEGLFRGRD